MRTIALLALAALVAAAAPASAAALTWNIETHDQFFTAEGVAGNNPTLSAAPGDTVNVTVVQKGNLPHNFVVRGLGNPRAPASGFLLTPDQNATVTFTVPEGATGEVEYVCEAHPTTMTGKIQIQGADDGGDDGMDDGNDDGEDATGGDDTPALGILGVAVALVGAVLLFRRK